MTGYAVHTNGIVLIDFLAPGEYQTGRSLYESYVLPTWKDCANIFYYSATTRAALISVLNGVISAARDQQFSPILHIDSHGSTTGMSTAMVGGESMSWSELATYLVEINRACKFNLILVTSSCHGANVISQLTPPGPAPFWGNIGPPDSTNNHALLGDFGEFYKIFLSRFEFTPAFEALNARIIDRSHRYVFTTADYWFIKLYAAFVHQEGSKVQLHRRVDRVFNLIPGAARQGRKRQAAIRKRLMDQMQDHVGYYKKFSLEFFMEEACPGTIERFGITFERVQELIRNKRNN